MNILISLIIAFSISYFYLRKINIKFICYSTTIFLLSFIILYYLGPANEYESFENNNLAEKNKGFLKQITDYKWNLNHIHNVFKKRNSIKNEKQKTKSIQNLRDHENKRLTSFNNDSLKIINDIKKLGSKDVTQIVKARNLVKHYNHVIRKTDLDNETRLNNLHKGRMSLFDKLKKSINTHMQELIQEQNNNTQEEILDEIPDEMSEEMLEEINQEIYDEIEEEIDMEMSDELNQEEINQEEELNTQEEHIRQSIEDDKISEEDDINEEINKAKNTSSITRNMFKSLNGDNNQINPGVGISSSSSPVNIYINGEKTKVDKFRNPNNSNKSDGKNSAIDNLYKNDNYYKKASRIHNNCDWINKDETYNYNKMSSCDNSINKISQTLNKSINSKKNDSNSEPCPLDVNKPWSNYKSGDDNEKDELNLEGFNL